MHLILVEALQFAVGLLELVKAAFGIVFRLVQGLNFLAIAEHDQRGCGAADEQAEGQSGKCEKGFFS